MRGKAPKDTEARAANEWKCLIDLSRAVKERNCLILNIDAEENGRQEQVKAQPMRRNV